MMLLSFTLVSLYFSISSAVSIDENISTLKHLLLSFKSSVTVNVYACWEPGKNYEYLTRIISLKDSHSDYAKHLLKTLNDQNFVVAIKQNLIDNFPTHEHNNVIALDLTCENVENSLEKVKIIFCQWKLFSGIERYFLKAERVIPHPSCRKA